MAPNVVTRPASLYRLDAIEGLRGYLAPWVLVTHVFWASGIESHELSGVTQILRHGELAVDVFMMISGFVIFLYLDTQQARYSQFIARRFWRLFPAFIVLFAVAIPISWLSLWNANHAGQYLTPEQAIAMTSNIQGWWENVLWHVPLHLSMLHGIVPDVVLPNAPGAFLIPAWSISLEWQFYLVAPFVFALATRARPWGRWGLAVMLALLLWAGHYVLPEEGVQFGAALPYQAGFFALGVASYFIYAHRLGITDRRPNVCFSAGLAVALVVYCLYHVSWTWSLIPVGLWIVFMGLILEPPDSLSSRLISPLFANPVSQHLGKISYSLYLSHILVIAVVQHLLLTQVPQVSRYTHFSMLLLLTFAVTLPVSTLLYRYIELPGIAVGRAQAQRLAARGAGVEHVLRT